MPRSTGYAHYFANVGLLRSALELGATVLLASNTAAVGRTVSLLWSDHIPLSVSLSLEAVSLLQHQHNPLSSAL